MHTPKRPRTPFFVGCGISLLLSLTSQAADPGGKDLDAAITAGDFAAQADNLTTWLGRKVPADASGITEDGLKALLKDPTLNVVLVQRQLITKFGADNLAAFAKASPDHKKFLSWLLHDTRAMELCLEAATPTGLKAREDNTWTLSAETLELWKKLSAADPDAKDGICLKLAIATALLPPGKVNIGAGGPSAPADPLVRYNHFKKAYKNKELVASFAKLTVWDYTKIVSSGASDEDLTWGREMIRTFRPDLGATEMVVDMTGLVWRRNSPVPYTNMKTVLQGGGKCGPRSSFAVFINQACGIPAIGVGQPAHACVAWRGIDGGWRVGYGKGWAASKLDGLSGPEFVEGSLARSQVSRFSQVEHLRWFASALTSHAQTAAVLAIARKIAKEAPTTKVDMNASLKPEEANADPGVEAAKPSAPVGKKDASTTAQTGPVKPVNGVIHVNAGTYLKQEGQAMFGGPSIILQDSHGGGKQVYFPQQLAAGWVEYSIDAPAAGKYELTMKTAAVNDGQFLQVGSDAFNAVSLVRVPMTHGLWATTKPVDVKLVQGIQNLRVTVIPGQRGVALHSFELKAPK
ncbi:MAG: hypothetical protein NTW21_29495 [Verrucomicrobia bacterium]|nr:hypothetical protein [Verrucomicrobiota bacterium]